MTNEQGMVSLQGLLLWAMTERTAREIEKLPSPKELKAMFPDTTQFQKRVLDAVARQEKENRRNGLRALRIAKNVLVAAAILTSLLASTLMVNAQVRAAVVNTIIEWTERAVGVQFEVEGEPMAALPEGYGPHYIPEGFIYQAASSWKQQDAFSYGYEKAGGIGNLSIEASVANGTSGYWMDNEQIAYDQITFEGEPAYLGTFHDGTGYVMLWVSEGVEVMLYYNDAEATLTELYRIAEQIY